MDINSIRSDGLNLEAAAPTQRNQNASGLTERAAPTVSGDITDLSKLGRLLADNNKQYEQDSSVRPEKIEQFKDFVDHPADISDSQVDIIIQRMLDN